MPILTPITLDPQIIDESTITPIVGNDCTSPAGHCYGADGGTQKVKSGMGGEKRVQGLSADKTQITDDSYYDKCQYCGKLLFVETKAARDARSGSRDSNADAQRDINSPKTI